MTPTAKALEGAGIPVAFDLVHPDALEPNPWNPNRMDARTLEAERESIRLYGFVDPVTVRAHPDKEGRYQIIDGEHRWRVATDLGITVLPIAVIKCDEPTAKRLTVILNETRGQSDEYLLGELLRDLGDELGDDLGKALAFDPREVKELTGLSGEGWDDFDEGDLDAAPPRGSGFTLAFRFDGEQRRTLDRYREKLGLDKDRTGYLQAITEAVTSYAEGAA